MPKKRKLNSKNPKYQPKPSKSEQEKVVKKLLCEIPGKAKVYGVFSE